MLTKTGGTKKMVAVVHGGNLGRWFEKLCRLDHFQLREVVALDFKRLRPRALPSLGGVYAFWWTGPKDLLCSERCNRLIKLAGPGGRSVLIEIDDEWLGLDTSLPNLRLSEERMLSLSGGPTKSPRPTTSCQLRWGVEHLFPNETDTRALILENVGLSYVRLHGDENAANRFYLEDLAVGLMRPPLNIDIER
jgi:hypothetical protein